MTQESPDRSDARIAIFDAIDKHDDGDDAPLIGTVVDDALARDVRHPSSVFEAFAALFKRGEVYEPKPGHVRRTSDGGRE